MTDAYIYGALLLSKAGKPIDRSSLTGVMAQALGGSDKVDSSRVLLLVTALEGVDIKKTIAQMTAPIAAPAPQAVPEAPKEEPKKEDEDLSSGLRDLFG